MPEKIPAPVPWIALFKVHFFFKIYYRPENVFSKKVISLAFLTLYLLYLLYSTVIHNMNDLLLKSPPTKLGEIPLA